MRRSSTSRIRVFTGGLAVFLTALGVTQVTADRRAPTEVTPQLPMAMVESVLSQTPTVSDDGRWVAFSGTQPGSETSATGPVSTVWLKDRTDDSLIELTPTRAQITPGDSVWPVISGDGCTVTVITELQLDLFRDDDTADRWDVYRLLLPHCDGELGDWELVSATSGSGFEVTAGDDVDPAFPPAVSADGNLVAYTRQFDVATDNLLVVTFVDTTIAIGDPGRALPVDGTPASTPTSNYRYRGLREPTMSADGQVIAFTSDATSDALTPEWGSGPNEGGFATSKVYVWDRSPTVDVVDTAAEGVVEGAVAPEADVTTSVRLASVTATGHSGSPALSGDGRILAFVSTATDLVAEAVLPPCGATCVPQVYLFDRTDGSTRLGSRTAGDLAAPPVGADAGASQPALNFTGDELLFVSRSSNLFPTRSQGVGDAFDGDVVLALPNQGTIARVSVLADGISPAPAANSHPRISANGRTVVFDTLAGAVYGTPQTGRQVAIVEHAPSVTMSNLDFGTVAVGFPGPEWFLVLTNNGPSSFHPTAATVDNDDFLISGGSCLDQARVVVPAGGSCSVHLMLMPSVAGERTGTLTVTEEGFKAATVSAELTGLGGEPALASKPASGHSPLLLVGSRSEPMVFAIENVAFGSVKVKAVRIEGSHPGDFEVVVDECTGKSLSAASTCALNVAFTPQAGGRRSGNIVVETADGAYTTLLVSGDSFYDPQLSVAVPSMLAGGRLGVTGSGFPANSDVLISWADGTGGSAVVTSDAAGAVSTQFIVRATDRAGHRSIVAQTTGGLAASAAVLIISPSTVRGANSPTWPGR